MNGWIAPIATTPKPLGKARTVHRTISSIKYPPGNVKRRHEINLGVYIGALPMAKTGDKVNAAHPLFAFGTA